MRREPMKVLIVDDDINTVDAIRRSLDWEKLEIGEVCYAYEIAGAKKILTEESIDIVVCDIEMPMGSNGQGNTIFPVNFCS